MWKKKEEEIKIRGKGEEYGGIKRLREEVREKRKQKTLEKKEKVLC